MRCEGYERVASNGVRRVTATVGLKGSRDKSVQE